jgi:hypothetical protein
MAISLGTGEHTFDWLDSWAKIPDSPSARAGWAHHGLATTGAGEIIAFHPGDPRMLAFDSAGNLLRSWDADVPEAHGITAVKEGATDYLWIADQGAKRIPGAGYPYQPAEKGWQVLKQTLDGTTVARLERPGLAVYDEARYAPTGVAVNEERHGGNGDVWVTDGYSQNLVHRFTKAGDYVSSIDGEEGSAGRFACPHNIWFDTRKSEPELYVADRTNHRVQVYDADGHFKRAFGADFLSSPSAFAPLNGHLVIGELRARLAIVDEHDRLIGYLGANEAVCTVDGWPNVKNTSGEPTRSHLLEPGRFNSPHGLTTDAAGNIYVSEWLIGGRFTKLARS